MAFELPPLPYPENALEPVISAETLSYHHGKHHRAYVRKLAALTEGTPLAGRSLEDLVRSESGALFNQAAQAWNHAFYWRCMSPDRPGPGAKTRQAIEGSFGSWSSFETRFAEAAVAHFGAGWAWLVKAGSSNLEVVTTDNAGNPLNAGATPLLTCDVWEHAYYIDYRNDRKRYVEAWWSIVDWSFVEARLTET